MSGCVFADVRMYLCRCQDVPLQMCACIFADVRMCLCRCQDVSLQISGYVFADVYITVLKTKMEICKDGRRVETGSFSSTVSI